MRSCIRKPISTNTPILIQQLSCALVWGQSARPVLTIILTRFASQGRTLFATVSVFIVGYMLWSGCAFQLLTGWGRSGSNVQFGPLPKRITPGDLLCSRSGRTGSRRRRSLLVGCAGMWGGESRVELGTHESGRRSGSAPSAASVSMSSSTPSSPTTEVDRHGLAFVTDGFAQLPRNLQSVWLPKGTLFPVHTMQSYSTYEARPYGKIRFELDQDVVINGFLVAMKGDTAKAVFPR